MNANEDFNMDDCHDALDCVNRAAKLAFENDTELESKCEAFTGKIFFKGLVKLVKAKLHLTNCVRLAATLAPKDVSQEAWHMLAVKQLQEVRDILLKEENEKLAAADKPFLDMIRNDLDKITSEVKKGCRSFLEFVNNNYVPVDRKIDLTEEKLKDGELRRTMIRLFLPIFHPDKNIDEPKQIQLLRQEITKRINVFNEEMKGIK